VQMLIPCEFAGKQNRGVASTFQLLEPAVLMSAAVGRVSTRSTMQHEQLLSSNSNPLMQNGTAVSNEVVSLIDDNNFGSSSSTSEDSKSDCSSTTSSNMTDNNSKRSDIKSLTDSEEVQSNNSDISSTRTDDASLTCRTDHICIQNNAYKNVSGDETNFDVPEDFSIRNNISSATMVDVSSSNHSISCVNEESTEMNDNEVSISRTIVEQ